MKIALIVTGGLHPSGREQVIPSLLWFIERLAQEHEVHAFALRHLPEPTTYRLCGATIHDFGRPHGWWRQWSRLVQALGATGPFDVIHGYWANPAGVLAALAGRRLGIPSVVTCDSGEFTALPRANYGLQRSFRGRAIVRLACRGASVVHVTSTYMRDLAARHGVDTVQIPLGVVSPYARAPALATDGPPWRLLQVSSLNPVKDQSTLLAAVALARRSLDVRLAVIGEDTLSGRLQQEASSLGIADVVTFHGFVAQEALSPFHRAAHLYVQSSLHEAAGVAVLEAAAAGVPIVGTRVGFVSDWDGRAAVAVPPANVEALAQAIVALIGDPARRAGLARAAHMLATQQDADYTARRMSELYRSLCGNR